MAPEFIQVSVDIVTSVIMISVIGVTTGGINGRNGTFFKSSNLENILFISLIKEFIKSLKQK